MKTSELFNDVISALMAVQAEVEPAPKDKNNPHFKSRYADLTSVWGACKNALIKNHLLVLQSPTFADGRLILITRIFHKSGQWIENELSMKPKHDAPQEIGACITYARRYALGTILGIITEDDDDGETAQGRSEFRKLQEANKAFEEKIKQLIKQIDELKKQKAVENQKRAEVIPMNKPAKIFHANDPVAAMWLQDLIKAKGLPYATYMKISAELDGRDINTVLPTLLAKG